MNNKEVDELAGVLGALTDARAICQALYNELDDVDGKLKLVSEHPFLLDQAQALTGIERDYLTKAIDGIEKMLDGDGAPIRKNNNCELAAAGQHEREQ